MEFFESLAFTFAGALVTMFVVAIIQRFRGSKQNWGFMLGIAVGLTVAQAFNDLISVPPKWRPIVVAACVGACALASQIFSGSTKREA